ncbi:MAG: rubrerythrin family protein [Spirochaetia bacterium]|nr:rubrerythrin family protein [Spirochaetia bacterium]
MTIPRNAFPAIFSNLAKASEKQQLYVLEKLFSELSESMQLKSSSRKVSPETIKNQITEDLQNQYPEIMKKAEYTEERGVHRALRWGEKVTTLQKSLIDRYLLKGDEFFVENDLFICEACGFIFLGKTSPGLCPVCKAPEKRFTKVS